MDDFRLASRQSWSAVAADWGELTALVDRQLGAAAEWMIDAVDLQPGERVLELAGGPGTVSLIASRKVGEQGRVICTDFAEPMVDVARRRIGAENATNVECRVMDAEAIDLGEEAADVVLCRMGYMLMADPAKALLETARVLAPGGRLALAVWSDPSLNPWATLLMQALMAHLGVPPPPLDTPGLWALADEQRLVRVLEEAGLTQIRTERLDDHVSYASVEQWFEQTSRLAGPLRTLIANLDSEARSHVVHGLNDAASSYRAHDGSLSMPEQMLVASAHRA